MKLKRISIVCLFIISLNGTVSANPELLEKFHSPEIGSLNWEDMVDTLYQMELTNRGLPFLIKMLSDPSQFVRQRALVYILKFYPEQRALKALTTYFIGEPHLHNRKMAASAIARIDPEYARRYFRKHLYADIDTQHIVVEILVQLKDESVIPVLAKQLKPYARPWSLIETAERLADFNDKRAISVVIDFHKKNKELRPELRQNITALLSRFDDERIYPTLVKAYKEHVRRGISLPPIGVNLRISAIVGGVSNPDCLSKTCKSGLQTPPTIGNWDWITAKLTPMGYFSATHYPQRNKSTSNVKSIRTNTRRKRT